MADFETILVDSELDLSKNPFFLGGLKDVNGAFESGGNIQFGKLKNNIRENLVTDSDFIPLDQINYISYARVGDIGLYGGYFAYKKANLGRTLLFSEENIKGIEVSRKPIKFDLGLIKEVKGTSIGLGEGENNTRLFNVNYNDWYIPSKDDLNCILPFIIKKFNWDCYFTSSFTPEGHHIIYFKDKFVTEADIPDINQVKLALVKYYKD